MKNEKWYKETFDKVHVPEELLGKVMNMENQTEKKAKRRWRYAMGALAAAFGLFVASNAVCYAATGETWVSKITFYLNGEKYERDITWQEYKDGEFTGICVTIPMTEFIGNIPITEFIGNIPMPEFIANNSSLSASLSIFMEAEDGEMINNKDISYSLDDGSLTIVEGADVYETENAEVSCKVETDEDGSVWLRLSENDVCKAEVDLTADLADGVAEGDFVYDGFTYHYQVTQASKFLYELMLYADLAEE